jgi:uncharacterized protein (DUF924 family)
LQDFERLGVFYLGRRYDADTKKATGDLVLYDSKDLVTHALCVGMTGSGKTGLGIAAIEEAAIDGVPVIVIDPKGDLTNLLLTFPDLRPEDFAPWIDEDDARRAGKPVAEFAADQADRWKKGLMEWGQDGARIKRLRDAADFVLYTPGSTAGTPVSVLTSLERPTGEDPEVWRERVPAIVSSLLALVGVEAAPLKSREHILLSTILLTAWQAGESLDMATLIRRVQHPPITRIGVVDIDAFFPPQDRFGLAMSINALIASPGFEVWNQGDPLDVAAFLRSDTGKPRVSIFTLAHLDDSQRMFFVSLLLNAIAGWMRGQTGTSSLRAMVYMDEIFGFFPPVSNPPSKGPLLTLLKQGRAAGVGVVLATQNPVDLDYKGLSNIGTWWLGRLQTERDKARLLDGLEGASAASLDRAEVDRILSSLGKRVFLLHDIHEKGLVTFQTRWTMSYLRGPLSRDQIRLLTGDAAPKAQLRSEARAPKAAAESSDRAPVVPPGIEQFFIPPAGAATSVVYSPVVLGAARVGFTDSKLGIDASRDVMYAAPVEEGAVAVDWAKSVGLDVGVSDLRRAPEAGASFTPLPAPASNAKNYAAWEKSFKQWLAQNERVDVFRHRETGLTSRPDESEGDLKVRVQDAARASRDAAVEEVRRKYAARQAALAEKLRRAEASVARETEQSSQQKLQTAVSIGATLFGALLGRKPINVGTLGRATTAARGVGRTMKEAGDIQRANESVEAVRAQVKELDDQVREETQAIAANFERAPVFERATLLPKRGQVTMQLLALGWDPE